MIRKAFFAMIPLVASTVEAVPPKRAQTMLQALETQSVLKGGVAAQTRLRGDCDENFADNSGRAQIYVAAQTRLRGDCDVNQPESSSDFGSVGRSSDPLERGLRHKFRI